MSPRRAQLAWEQRWSRPVAVAALLAVVAFVVSGAVASSVSGDGEAAVLRAAQEHSSDVTLSGVVETIAFLLLAFPLAYLFRVVKGRAERMQGQMIVLAVLAPLCLAISTGLGVAAKHDAANRFTAGEAKSTLSRSEARKECASEKESGRASCEQKELEDDKASNAASEASPAGLATIFGLIGGLSLIVGMFYTSLWAMRTGVLSRFWAALGMALGVTVLLGIILFLLLWLVYLGLLIGGWVPGGRPPAWEAGEAIPWPTPGEKAAADLEPKPEEPEDPEGPSNR
jgi:hypothetical protein